MIGWAQVPAAQTASWQAMPSLVHAAPFGEGDQAVVLCAGWHDAQSTPGSAAPAVWHAPAIRHSFAWSGCVQLPA